MSGAPNRLSSYLKYLPAIYGLSQDGEPPFVGSYLNVFEKIISGIPEPAHSLERKGIRELLDSHVFGTLFHPRLDFLFDGDPSVAQTFIPFLSTGDEAQPGTDNEAKLALLKSYITTVDDQPIKVWLHGFLNWFSGTIALNVDHNWSIDSKRFLIAQALPLFRARGTAQGMEWLLNAWFGVDPDAPPGLAPDGGLGLVGFRVYNEGFLPIRIEDSETGTFRLENEPPPGGGGARLADIVCQDVDNGENEATGYRAWHFVVSLLTRASHDRGDAGRISDAAAR
ncbi:phage tail protein [Trinickia dinghuensis]|uniref:phage tail protein n=1 Tax=Trinickia dinghuensis TaxID=2291023 RepID=UPI0015F15DCD|nr:phage tail protein [Trinickia dinghuensis]